MADTLVYDFEVQPGDLLVWHPQWYHNTTVVSDQDSIALVNHIPTDQIDRSSMFYDAFWASTRYNENIAGIYEIVGRSGLEGLEVVCSIITWAGSDSDHRWPRQSERWLEDSRLGEL